METFLSRSSIYPQFEKGFVTIVFHIFQKKKNYNLEIIFHFFSSSTIFHFLNFSLRTRRCDISQTISQHHEKDQRPKGLQKVTQCRTTWKNAENKSHSHTHTPPPTRTNLLIRSPVENFRLTRKLELCHSRKFHPTFLPFLATLYIPHRTTFFLFFFHDSTYKLFMYIYIYTTPGLIIPRVTQYSSLPPPN